MHNINPFKWNRCRYFFLPFSPFPCGAGLIARSITSTMASALGDWGANVASWINLNGWIIYGCHSGWGEREEKVPCHKSWWKVETWVYSWRLEAFSPSLEPQKKHLSVIDMGCEGGCETSTSFRQFCKWSRPTMSQLLCAPFLLFLDFSSPRVLNRSIGGKVF